MWYIGQTVLRISDKQLVVFLGYGQYKGEDKNIAATYMMKQQDGHVYETIEFDNYTHVENEDGIIVGGDSIKGGFFGIVKPEEWDAIQPDKELEKYIT